MDPASESTNVLSIINIALSSVVLLIFGVLATWLFNVQKERFGVKDDRIKGLEDQLKAARDINEVRVKLATEQRDATQRQLTEALEARGLAGEMQSSGFAELDSESRLLLTSLLERLEGLEQFAPPIEMAENHLVKGNAHYGAGELDEAISEYTQAISLDPKYDSAYYNRGTVFATKGEDERAMDDFNVAIRINPDFEQAYANRAGIYNEKGQYERAIEDCNKAMRLNPRSAEAYGNRGNAYHSMGEYENALEDFTEVIRLNPKYTFAYNNRSATHSRIRKYENAIEDARTAIELDRKYTNAYVNRGIAYTFLGKPSEAEADFARAVELGYDRADIEPEIEEIRQLNEESE